MSRTPLLRSSTTSLSTSAWSGENGGGDGGSGGRGASRPDSSPPPSRPGADSPRPRPRPRIPASATPPRTATRTRRLQRRPRGAWTEAFGTTSPTESRGMPDSGSLAIESAAESLPSALGRRPWLITWPVVNLPWRCCSIAMASTRENGLRCGGRFRFMSPTDRRPIGCGRGGGGLSGRRPAAALFFCTAAPPTSPVESRPRRVSPLELSFCCIRDKTVRGPSCLAAAAPADGVPAAARISVFLALNSPSSMMPSSSSSLMSRRARFHSGSGP